MKMNTLNLLFIGGAILYSTCFTPSEGFKKMEIEVSVQDEVGQPVADAQVKTGYYHWMLRSPISNLAFPLLDMNDFWVTSIRRTNKQGKCSFSFYSKDSRIPFVVEKDGYYVSRKILTDRMPETKQKWTKEPQRIDMRIKPIINPILLQTNNRREIELKGPFNEFVGFDFLRSEWMPPYGNGEHEDIKFKVTLQPNIPKNANFKEAEILFYGENNGGAFILNSSIIPESTMPYPSIAPEKGYENKRINITKKVAVQYEREPQNQHMFIRIRTQVDENDQIQEAIYGRMEPFEYAFWGERFMLRLVYFINPTPNDKNLEPIRNEFGNILLYTPPTDEEQGKLR